MPHDYFAEVLHADGIDLPEPGAYATGVGFFAQDYRQDLTTAADPKPTTTFPSAIGSPPSATSEESLVAQIAAEEGLSVLAHRDVPHDESVLGETARTTMPRIRQVFLIIDERFPARDQCDLARRAYIVRKRLAVARASGPTR